MLTVLIKHLLLINDKKAKSLASHASLFFFTKEGLKYATSSPGCQTNVMVSQEVTNNLDAGHPSTRFIFRKHTIPLTSSNFSVARFATDEAW